MLVGAILAGMPGTVDRQSASAQDEPVRYKIRNIGVIEGDAGSLLFAINEEGVAVGLSIAPDNAGNRAVMFRSGKLLDLSGGDERSSTVWAINQDGISAGFFAETPQTSGAATWDGEATTVLPRLEGGDNAQAFGINDEGVVVGGSNTAPGEAVEACRWENGEVTALPSLADGGIASAINNRGQIVGSSAGHAVLWDGDEVTDLGTIAGPTSLGRSINDAGQIVGHTTTTADGTFGNEGTHAFLWEEGQMTDLGTLNGSAMSFAWDINAHGVVVGSSSTLEPPDDSSRVALIAVMWVDGEIVDLNGLIPADSDWELATAYGINDAGQIVGFGYNKGRQRGFILTPEETETA